ncbi:hypothetical protein ZWY2020_037853 [Hordeum vulgare]|nr:hypothetical protein ZWY2020_037853 [Hordeum vulgare]
MRVLWRRGRRVRALRGLAPARKIAVVELFTVHRVRSFRAVREEEVAATPRVVSEAAAVGTSCSCPTRTTGASSGRSPSWSSSARAASAPSAPSARRRSLQPSAASVSSRRPRAPWRCVG